MRTYLRKWLVAVVVAAAVAPASMSAQVVDLLGDKDCFGLGGSCPDGTRWRDDLGGTFFTSNQGPGDPAFTDIWFTPTGLSWTHTYALPASVTSASLVFRTAGIADFRGPWNVTVNGNLAGTIPTNVSANAFQEVLTRTFVIDPLWLTGNDLVALNTNGGDGFSIDYSELTLNVSAVPEPSTLLLLAGGLAVLGAATRRRRQA